MIAIIIGIVGAFISLVLIDVLIDIRFELERANNLKKEELELLKKQNRIFEINRL
jgi:hypothetical protein